MNILHITDLHFTLDKHSGAVLFPKKRWKKLISLVELRSKDEPIDMIAVTGDLTSHGEEAEFEKAFKYLKRLTKAAKVGCERVVFCWGNHDADGEMAHSEFTHYEAFLKKFYAGREPVLFWKHQKKGKKSGKKLLLQCCCLNTCTETSLLFFDHAVLIREEFEQLEKFKEGAYGIVLMHHQPEVIQNQELFEEMVNSKKVRLILCGHLHPTETRIFRAGNAIVVNGIALSPHLKWLPAGFQMIRINSEGKLRVKEIILE